MHHATSNARIAQDDAARKARPAMTVAQPPTEITATCPTCGQVSTFTYLGAQAWPERVAAKLNIDPITHSWRCDCCQTTVTDLHKTR